MILLLKLLFPKWIFMFSPTWSTFPLCLCCFLKQIIGSPIIIMYLSLKKTFSLYCGIKARADLLCIRKLAQGILVILQPPPRDTGAVWNALVSSRLFQSANPQVFHMGYETCLETFCGHGTLASCLGMKGGGRRAAITPGPPTVLCPPQPHPAQPPHGWQRCPHQLPEICVLLPRRLVPRYGSGWQVTKRNLFLWPQSKCWKGLVASPLGSGPRSADTSLSPPGSSGSGPWNWKLQLRLLLWPMVSAAHFFHMVELLPRGMYLLAEQMGSDFCWVFHVAF